MKTNIRVVFKDGNEDIFEANAFGIKADGFFSLEDVDEDDNSKLVAYVSVHEVRYLKFVKVEE